MLRARMVVVTLLATLGCAANASAAPGVVQDLPGCRTAQLPANDDDSTGAVPLGFTATMFDTSFSSVYVNNNGNVTVANDLAEFTPFDFRETGEPMIAPFFADVDTSGTGSGLVNYGQVADYGGRKAFCVIWDHVGYYDSHTDKLNTFQLIIVDQGAAGIDIVANYDSITWETGDASDGANGFGGVSAVAGYAAGDGDAAHALVAPGSFTNGGLLDSNAGTEPRGSLDGQPAARALRVPAAPDRAHGRAAHRHRDQPRHRIRCRARWSGLPRRRRLRVADRQRRRPLHRGQPAGGHLHRHRLPGPRRGVLVDDADERRPHRHRHVHPRHRARPAPPPPPDGTTITSIDETAGRAAGGVLGRPADAGHAGLRRRQRHLQAWCSRAGRCATARMTEIPAGSGRSRRRSRR